MAHISLSLGLLGILLAAPTPTPIHKGNNTHKLKVRQQPTKSTMTLQKRPSFRLVQGRFALALRRALNPSGNSVFSPLSVSAALSLLYAGAQQKTAQELQQALQSSLPVYAYHLSFGKWFQVLNPPRLGLFPPRRMLLGKSKLPKPKLPAYQLHLANRLWLRKDRKLLRPYRVLVRQTYDASIVTTSFNKPEQVRKTVNQWVTKNTQEMIKNMMPKGSIRKDTSLLLINAIAFQSKWQTQFDKKLTKKGRFWVSATKSKQADMMKCVGWHRYEVLKDAKGKGQGYLLDLPYKGKELLLRVVVPKRREGLKQALKLLTAQQLTGKPKSTRQHYLSLTFPRFRIEGRLDLKKVLQRLGVKQAFTQQANFASISRQKLRVSRVLHKAMIEVDEHGTKAAAATAVSMFPVSLPPKPTKVEVNRPFFFAVIHQQTGAILFMGQVKQPR